MRRDFILVFACIIALTYLVYNIPGEEEVMTHRRTLEFEGFIMNFIYLISTFLVSYVLSAILYLFDNLKTNKVLKWLNEAPGDPTNKYAAKIYPKNLRVYSIRDIKSLLEKEFVDNIDLDVEETWIKIYGELLNDPISSINLGKVNSCSINNPTIDEEIFMERVKQVVQDFNITHLTI